MSIKLVGVLAGAAVLVAGCGAADGSDESVGSTVSTVRATGPFFGECGSVTDEEVAEAFGVPGFGTVVRNSVGCEWQVSQDAGQGGPHVSFSWYRGSPIGRERAGSELIGRPAADIEIAGNPGFEASVSSRLCELGVEFGDGFVHWSVAYVGSVPTADPCVAARELAELTVARGK
ncbi:DUF3558 domain-containing protein [Prescottella defluvii]|uniref:DUF3558 domain-containing protein n=1 Tax=Prescottella defluvii TaxID=1323361 RepID=UPI0004F3A855|nr:DUF3558 domain-containing protein [Prescottella defluvii]